MTPSFVKIDVGSRASVQELCSGCKNTDLDEESNKS